MPAHSSNTSTAAREIFVSYLERLEAGDAESFETLCAQHPEHVAALRALHRGDRAAERLFDAAMSGGDWSGSFFGTQPRAGGRELGLPAFPGRVLGGFELVRLIGQGGMGQVWEAEQTTLERRVALKLVRPERVNRQTLELFAREARAGGRLSHPGIVAVHAHGETDGMAWIAMELVEGGWTLRDFLDEAARAEKLPEGYHERVARFVVELADALHTAHSAGVIHRDVKPQNVLITADEHPKVADFGLARIVDESALSQTGELRGTYSYMSPEQVASRSMELDERTDVFSLGVVLYEMLTLRRPFEGDTTRQVAEQILTIDPPDPRSLRSRVPRDLAVICLECMQKARDKRYGSMEELSADLRRYLAGEAIRARPPGALERGVKAVRRHPAASAILGSTSAAALAVAGLLAAVANKSAQLERTNLDLTEQRASLTRLGTSLTEAHTRAELEAARAEDNEHEARANAAEAQRQRESVLRLAALHELDELVLEADELWPPYPSMIHRYEDWLERAEQLVASLYPSGDDIGHLAQLEELRERALPMDDEQLAAARRAYSRWPDLEAARRELATLQGAAAVRAGGPFVFRGVEIMGPDFDPEKYLMGAWRLVRPDRKQRGKEGTGLNLVRAIVESGVAGDLMPRARQVLAWALFAHGLDDHALAEMEAALALASGAELASLERSSAELVAAIEAVRGTEGARALAATEERVRELEDSLSIAVELEFDAAEDRWWYRQLQHLVSRLTALEDEHEGLMGTGIHDVHGWGVRRRLEQARRLEAGFVPGGNWHARWLVDMPEIAKCYHGIELTPQMGLVPLGRAAGSGLWEFAHVLSGDLTERDDAGELSLSESSGVVLVLLPGGTFWMGAQGKDPSARNFHPGADPSESPVHEVTLSAFLLSKYEVTQAQWQRLTGKDPSINGPHGQWAPTLAVEVDNATLLHPVESVSWEEYDLVLSRFGLDLPSEAQWEYGARGGTQTAWWTGSEAASLQGCANLADSHAERTWGETLNWGFESWLDDDYTFHAPVDMYRPNPFGLYQVHGNLWEWVRDAYSSSYRPRPANLVQAEKHSEVRILRGGGFTSEASFARSAYRKSEVRSAAGGYNGVRPARALDLD